MFVRLLSMQSRLIYLRRLRQTEQTSEGFMDVVVVRLLSHGHRYELPCHRHKFEEYIRKGRAHPPEVVARIVVVPSIFTNCHRKELATNANLQAAFQTTSFDLIAPAILQFGEVVANEKDRNEKRNERKELQETVYRMSKNLLVGKFTGVHPEESDLRDELKSTKEARCVDHVDPLLQAAYFASIVVRRERLDCLRLPKRLIVVYDVKDESTWNDFLLDFDGLIVSRKKTLSTHTDSEGIKSDCVELNLLADLALDAQDHPRWKMMIQKAKATKEVPLEADDSHYFSYYEFTLPEPETPDEVDLTNRLQALEKMQSPHVEDDASRSPNKSKKARKQSHSFGSEDDEDGPSNSKTTTVAVSKFDVMTHKQLQDMCRQYKLSTGGKKQDLVERLEAFDDVNKPKARH